MTNQPLDRDPHRFQPDDQFQQSPQVPPEPVVSYQSAQPAEEIPSPLTAPEQQAQPTPGATAAPLVDPDSLADIPKQVPEEILVEWEAPSRPHKKRQRQYYLTITAMVVLIGIILFTLGQFLPIAVLFAVGFLVYVIEMVPPTNVKHSISNYGIRVEGNLYYWDELGRFWFTERHGFSLLHLEIDRFPSRVTLLLGDIPQEEMKATLEQVLINQRPPLTPFEKAAAWLERTLPLENPTSHSSR